MLYSCQGQPDISYLITTSRQPLLFRPRNVVGVIHLYLQNAYTDVLLFYDLSVPVLMHCSSRMGGRRGGGGFCSNKSKQKFTQFISRSALFRASVTSVTVMNNKKGEGLSDN